MARAIAAAAIPRPSRRQAQLTAEAELAALLTLLPTLTDEDWQRDTACAGWTVRDVAAHLAGSCEEAVRSRVLVRHIVTARRHHLDKPMEDALSLQQVRDRAGRSGPEIFRELYTLGPRAVRARARPLPSRLLRIPQGNLAGRSVGYLNDVIMPRDMWVHRWDIASGAGRPFDPGAHAEQIVAQAIRDLADLPDVPTVTLELHGAVQGRWSLAPSPAPCTVRVDAVALMLLLTGRAGDSALVGDDQDQLARLRQLRVPVPAPA